MTPEPNSDYSYQLGGNLSINHSTYVVRQADLDLYNGLKDGEYCYVLNSRQMGKSSLRVQTMYKLQAEGIACAEIDLSAISSEDITAQVWYEGIIYELIKAFKLKIDRRTWLRERDDLSPVQCFNEFIEKVLLTEFSQHIVIFLDEIDSVPKLNIRNDFFAFIRACYNKRADSRDYRRLTFCLIGATSPNNLIKDKKRTPFNIGKGISLKGFQLDEVDSLKKGLQERYPKAEAEVVIEEILKWTGGQPFLTQKLCQLMVEESEKENPRTVQQVVKSRIIENWQYQDDPTHLRYISERILISEQSVPYLLELYQQIWQTESGLEVTADDTQEQSELQFSGLVVRKKSKLRIYNPIYKEIFDRDWISTQLRNLCPYAESFQFWKDSGGTDESRLLRGKTLQDGLSWAKGKSLEPQHRDFLSASRDKETEAEIAAKKKEAEIAAKKKEAQLEREKKDREAAEQRNRLLTDANQTLVEANKKAIQRIRRGSIALGISLLFAVTFGILSVYSGKQVVETGNYLKTVAELTELAAEVQAEVSYPKAEELFSLARQSVNIKNKNLQLAIVDTGIADANLKLKGEDWTTKVENYLKKVNITSSDDVLERLQLQILFFKVQGNLQKEKQENTDAINFYKKDYDLFKELKSKTSINISPPFNEKIPIEKQILPKEVVEELHRELIDLLSNENNENSLKQEVEDSLKEHYYNELANLLKNQEWKQADEKTTGMILYILRRDREQGLDEESIKNFPCDDLRRINNLWVKHSRGNFGFSKQKQIYIKNGNRLGIELKNWNDKDIKNIEQFPKAVGWDDKNTAKDNSGSTTGKRGRESGNPQEEEEKMEGYYPYDLGSVILWTDREKSSYYPYYPYRLPLLLFFSRAEACKV